jgi:phenylacetate-coenzyme A ligase PaaK-like adenylate-forming protein
LLAHAYKTTRYYRELFDSNGLQPRDIRSLSDFSQAVPPLTRSIVSEDEIDVEIAGKHRLLRSDISAQMAQK